jgi:DNA-binding GntR family transcriptional regulator
MKSEATMTEYRERISRYEDTGLIGDSVYAMLRDCILDGSLKPGSPVRIDRIAKEIGISRTPVREAIRRLEAEDFVVPKPRQGLVVKGLSEQELVELFQIREALESQAAWLATRNLSAGDIVDLAGLIARMEKVAENDPQEFRDLTGAFYRTIARAARNERLCQLILDMQARVRQFGGSTLFVPGRAKARLEELRSLLAAFKAGDADAAADIVREHRRRTLDLRLQNYRDESGRSPAHH